MADKQDQSWRSRPVFIFGVAGCVLVALSIGLALYLFMVAGPKNDFPYRVDLFKTLLQLFLVTGCGGLFVAGLAWLRDRDATRLKDDREAQVKRELRVATLQAIDRELGQVYRALKMVKRQLRSQIVKEGRTARDWNPPYEIPTEAFRKTMRDLLEAQVRAEDLRDALSARTDLFPPTALAEIHALLHYAARFFHDVHEDWEVGRVLCRGDHCVVTADCHNLHSLIHSQFPDDFPKEIEAKILLFYDAPRKALPIGDAARALAEIESCCEGVLDRRRFRAVADSCFSLVSMEVRKQIGAAASIGPSYRAFR